MKADLKKAERTEEVQEIIERMPSGLGFKVTVFVFVLMAVFFCLSWVVKYPDSVTGEIVINSAQSPVKLVCNTPGRIKLIGYRNFDIVNEGDYIAIVQNSANLDDVKKLIALTSSIDMVVADDISHITFPKNLSLGDLNIAYFKFLSALRQYQNYNKSNLYDKQIETLSKLNKEYDDILEISIRRAEMSAKSLVFIGKSHDRDSILFSKNVLSESESDRSQITFLSSKDAYQSMLKEISNTRSQLQQMQNDLQLITLQKFEKEKELELELITSFVNLEDNIKSWEQKYTFKAPFSGRIQFIKFWTNNQFVEVGEPTFTVIPSNTNIIGQMTLPSIGAGKVEIGQKVIIKLRDYPYFEYGSINGKVTSIAMTSNSIITKNGEMETYLVNIDLPDKLKTNYGATLDFKFEIKGTGDIITNDRRLFERFFDNLRYKIEN